MTWLMFKISLILNVFTNFTFSLRTSIPINWLNALPNRKKYNNLSIVTFFKKTSLISTNLFMENTLPFYKITYPYLLSLNLWLTNQLFSTLHLIKKTFGEGFIYIRGLLLVFCIDAMIIDDEPLWEPIEWSMVQSWILFIFFFAWVAENLIVSRFGSYTGRDKRVWFSWYKTFWLISLWYAVSMGVAILFVMTPYYYEINYILSFSTLWWNWYTRVFFFKFISLLVIIVFITQIIQFNLRWFNWKKIFFLIILITFFLSFLLYSQFLITFFCYFTNNNWYNSSRLVDYIQLSHEPNKWSWGNKKRDHFSYHKSSTVFWFKNDGPMASSFMFLQFLLLLTLFLMYFYWLVLLRRVYTTQEFSYTYSIYAISSLKQFFYFFLLLYLFIVFSFFLCYWRLPIEFLWLTSTTPWFKTLLNVLLAYPQLLLTLF